MSTNPIDEVLNAHSIAVVGATNKGDFGGGGFLEGILKFGFEGEIYPINPKYSEIMGVKTYPTLRDVPGTIDYVISSVPAREVPKILEDAAQKGVKTVHLFTARLGETRRPEAVELEQRIMELAKGFGIRLIGPNCMGVYCPSKGFSFHADLPRQSGPVGLVCQSGMLARETVVLSTLRGIYFSKVFSYGNAVDLNECDFLDYLAHDPDTKVILMYIEGVRDGNRFFNILRQTIKVKPVVILKGGRGASGARATASHTASLAGTSKIWETMVAQAGAVIADSMDELVDLATSFYYLPPVTGSRVGIAGGTGGSSVLAADECEHAGLEVIPLPPEFREELKNRGVSVWDWLSNPADLSIREDDSLSVGLILELMARNPNFDLLIVFIGIHKGPSGLPDVPLDSYLQQQYRLEVSLTKPFLTVVPDRSVGIKDLDTHEWKMSCELRTTLINLNIPFYPTPERAATAARKLIDYYQRRDQ
ncbi:acetate--CoA ligase family protein [Chloroflexota bacterium]